MKKSLFALPLIVATLSYSSLTYADGWGGDWDDGGYYGGYYGRPQINNYYMPPPVYNYYPQPPVAYYPPPRRYYGGYGWGPQMGMAGGAIGSALGYEMSGGDPVAAGIGAAAGALLGNEFGPWR